MTYLETGLLLADILLATTGIMLTIVAIAIAVAAIFGYNAIKKSMIEKSTEIANERMNEFLEDENINQKIKDRVEKESDNLYKDIIMTSPDEKKENENE